MYEQIIEQTGAPPGRQTSQHPGTADAVPTARGLARNGWPYGYAAAVVLVGMLYGARSTWALRERWLDHAAHPGSGAAESLVVLHLLLAVVLLGCDRLALAPRVGIAIRLAAGGAAWTGFARMGEALEIPAPWGLVGAPGLLAVTVGLLWMGSALARSPRTRQLGHLITAAALLRAGGGLLSMLLFNLLGRTPGANWCATLAGHSLHILEAICWVMIGLILVQHGRPSRATAGRAAQARKKPSLR